jgi:Cu-Zn family superoxide dismutase
MGRFAVLRIPTLLFGACVGLIIALLAVTTAGAGVLAWPIGGSLTEQQAGPNVIRARAILNGPGGVSGEVRFTESPVDRYHPISLVEVVIHVEGLTPGLHGFHVHENGVCDPPAFTTAGGHFDPGPFGSSTPVDANHPYHAGDMPQIEANEAGIGHLVTMTSRFTLRENSGNQLSIFDANGSAVVVHLNPDLGLNGVVGASGGPRIACGVIELVGPGSQ